MNFAEPKETQTSLGPQFLSGPLAAGAQTRWLAMPTMRKFQRSPGPSHSAAQPAGRRCGRKSNYRLQSMSFANPSPCRKSHGIGPRCAMKDVTSTNFADPSRGLTSIARIPAYPCLRRVDNAKTRVYSRDTGLFSSPEPNLESQVRGEAERQLQQAALRDGILKTAADNARSTISGMLNGSGFDEVDFQ